MTNFAKFLSDDAGAVTIDWVALTAGVLLLGIMVVDQIFNDGVSSLGDHVNSMLSNMFSDVTSETVTIGGSTIGTATLELNHDK